MLDYISMIQFLVILICLISYIGIKERKEFDKNSNIIVGTITKIERIDCNQILVYIKIEDGEEIKVTEQSSNIGSKINRPRVGSKIKVIKLEDSKYISDYGVRCIESTPGSLYMAIIIGIIAIIAILCMWFWSKIKNI